MKALAEEFIDPSSNFVLYQLEQKLRQCSRSKPGCRFRWDIPEDKPLRTITSCGEYLKGRTRGRGAFASISSVWEIQNTGDNGKTFALPTSGIASTRVRVFEKLADSSEEEIAMWRMEVGQEDAPGCYFHAQVLGESEGSQFPKWLKIPRIPVPFGISTPTAALEFTLGELFQDRWPQHISQGKFRYETESWRRVLKARFTRALDWERAALEQRSLPTPWLQIKDLQPAPNMFVS